MIIKGRPLDINLRRMYLIKQDKIDLLYFCDIPVLKVELDLVKKQLTFHLKYVFIKEKSHPLFEKKTDALLGGGRLVFEDWENITILRCEDDREPIVLLNDAVEKLEDILVFEKTDNFVKIAGFASTTWFWEEWIIEGAKYYGEFEEVYVAH